MSYYNGLFPMASRPNGDQLATELVAVGITGALVVWDTDQVCVALYSDIPILNSGQTATVVAALAAHVPTAQSVIVPLQWVGLLASFPTGLVYLAGNPATVSTLTPVSSPAAISADRNDYSPGLASLVRITTDGLGNRNITGIVAGSGGQRIVIRNIGSDTITLKHQSASSAAANRIIGNGGSDIALNPGLSTVTCELIYDDVTLRWCQNP